MTYKILDLTKGEESLPLLMEYMSKKEGDGKYVPMSTFISNLKFATIFAATPDRVLPFILDDDFFVCATNGLDKTIIEETINFMSKHPNLKGLKKLTMEDEFTGKYLSVPRLLVNGISYVEN